MAAFGTDLNAAYMDNPIHYQSDMSPSLYSEKLDSFDPRPEPVQQPMQQQPPPQVAPIYDNGAIQKQLQYEQQMEKLQAQLQKYNAKAAKASSSSSEDSLWDTFWSKKKDMVRLLTWSCIILVALGLHSAFEYVIKQYLIEQDLTYKQELGVRFGYPLGVFMLLWLAKVMKA